MSNTNAYRVFVDATQSSHARFAIKRPNVVELEFHVAPFTHCGGKEALTLFGACKALEQLTDHAAPVEIVTPQHSITSLLKVLQADPLKVHYYTAFNSHARAAYTATLSVIGNRPVTFDNPTPNERYIFDVLEAEARTRLTAAA